MYISLDVGGTTIRIGAVEILDNVEKMQKISFHLTHNFEEDFSTLFSEIGKLSPEKVDGIGLGVTGRVDKTKSFMNGEAPNLREWLRKPLKQLFSNEFNCPIFIDNDAVVAGLGEAIYGAGQEGDFYYLIWGTGIGGAQIVHQGQSKKVTNLNWHAYFQAWEENCGGNKIKERFGKSGAELSDEEWFQVMKQFQQHLDNFITKAHPKKIVFGGGIAIKQSARLLPVAKNFPNVTIIISRLGENTGLYGGFALLKNSL